MEGFKKWIRNWLGFSGSETRGFLILLPLTVVILFSQPVYRLWLSNQPDDFSNDQRQLDSLVALWHKEDTVQFTPELKEDQRAILKPFDPNKTSVEDLQTLGFPKNLSIRIANYRQKGGEFRVKGDLMKIYGMDSSLYEQLYAYIQLPENRAEGKKDVHVFTPPGQKANLTIDINTADTTQLKNIYGIGSTLAKRIIKFRDGLGGFILPTQFQEVYGLDSAVVNKLNKLCYIDKTFEPKKININAADEKMLSSHPYIKRNIARAIVAYRFQHGDFNSVDELGNISLIQPSDAAKIKPYLKVKD